MVQEISTMRRAKIKSALSNQYVHMCKLEFEHSQYLFGKDITKNISKTKDMSKLKKHLTKDYSKSFCNSNSNQYKYLDNTCSNSSATTKASVFCARAGTHKTDHQDSNDKILKNVKSEENPY